MTPSTLFKIKLGEENQKLMAFHADFYVYDMKWKTSHDPNDTLPDVHTGNGTFEYILERYKPYELPLVCTRHMTRDEKSGLTIIQKRNNKTTYILR